MKLKIGPKLKKGFKIGGIIAGIIFVGGLAYYLTLDRPINPKEQKNVSTYLKTVCSSEEFKKKFPSLKIYTPKPGEYPPYLRPLPPAIFALTDVPHRQPLDSSTVLPRFIDSLTNYIGRNLKEKYPSIKIGKPSLATHEIWVSEKKRLEMHPGYRFYEVKKEGPLKSIFRKKWKPQKIIGK